MPLNNKAGTKTAAKKIFISPENAAEVKKQMETLRAGDEVLLSGIIYTARDAAHKRMFETLSSLGKNPNAKEKLPFEIENACIYYAGPSPAPNALPVGSIGPTTAGRMDKYTPALLDLGLAAMIGKGQRSAEVINSIIKNKAVNFGFIGGAGALAAACVKKCDIIAYEELGSEAVRRLSVENLPLTVIVDCLGNNLYKSGPAEYLKQI